MGRLKPLLKMVGLLRRDWKSHRFKSTTERHCSRCGGAANLFLPASDGFPGFFIGGAAAFGLAFIPELLAFGQG